MARLGSVDFYSLLGLERDASGERYEIGKSIAHVPGPSPAGVIATTFLAGWLVGLICAGGVWACARRGTLR